MNEREELLAKAAQDFVDKVDRGEARSTRSYDAFKKALLAPAQAERDAEECLDNQRRYALEEAAQIAEAIDSGRGNEKEIAKAIRALAVTSTMLCTPSSTSGGSDEG